MEPGVTEDLEASTNDVLSEYGMIAGPFNSSVMENNHVLVCAASRKPAGEKELKG